MIQQIDRTAALTTFRCGLALAITLATVASIACVGSVLSAQEPAADTDLSVWDGIYTQEQAERGATFYAKGCADCHGDGLAGDDISPPLIGVDFMWDWNGLSVGDLFERVRLSMPDGDPRSMTTQEKADVLAYVFSRNLIPAGDRELPDSTSALRPIAFAAVQP